MKDYWNDPPEVPEVPECCDEIMTVDEDGDCQCEICGKMIIAENDVEDIGYTEELSEP